MEKVIFENYDLSATRKQLNWPEQKPLVIGYCRCEDWEKAESHFVDQQNIVRMACDKKLKNGKYNLVWIDEIADGALPTFENRLRICDYRPGLALAIALLSSTSAAYIAAEDATAISTNPELLQWFTNSLLTECQSELILADHPSRSSVSCRAKSAKAKPQPPKNPADLTDEEVGQICNSLVWSDGSLDAEVSHTFGLERKALSTLMAKHNYHWNGKVWRSIRSIWDLSGELKQKKSVLRLQRLQWTPYLKAAPISMESHPFGDVTTGKPFSVLFRLFSTLTGQKQIHSRCV